MRIGKCMIAILVSMFLLFSVAFAEGFSWLDYTELQKEYEYLGLQLYRSEQQDNYKMDIYADDKFETAAIIMLDGEEIFSVCYADSTGKNGDFLQLMAGDVFAPEDNTVQTLFMLWLDQQLHDEVFEGNRTRRFKDYIFEVKKKNRVCYVTISASEYEDKVVVKSE